jgi:hypothetical protein
MSEKKVTPKARIGNVAGADLRDALDDLRRVDFDDPIALHRVAKSILESWEEIAAASGGLGAELSFGAAQQDGLHQKRQQRGRHDGKRIPAGYEFRGGGLYRDAERVPETERDRAVAGGIRDYVDGWLYWAPGMLGPQRDALESAFEVLHGFPFGEEWRAALEAELQSDAEAKAALGIRAAHPKESAGSTFIEPVSDEQFMVRMRMRAPEGTSFPPELDARAVAELRDRVALNKGGSKKTPRTIVQEFAETFGK